MSPFEIVYGRQPVLPIHLLDMSNEQIREDVETQNTRLTYNLCKMNKVVKKLLKDAAQARNEKWLETAKPLALKRGDWIRLKNQRIKVRKAISNAGNLLEQPIDTDTLLASAKFDSVWLGPYEVMTVNRNAITINDTDRKEMRTVALAHLKFFHAQNMSPASAISTEEPQITSSLPTQEVDTSTPTPPEAMLEQIVQPLLPARPQRVAKRPNNWDDYDMDDQSDAQSIEETDPFAILCVEKILTHRRIKGSIEYFVHWENLDESHDEWVPHKNFYEVDLISEYWQTICPLLPLKELPAKFRHLHPDFEEKQSRRGKRNRSNC